MPIEWTPFGPKFKRHPNVFDHLCLASTPQKKNGSHHPQDATHPRFRPTSKGTRPAPAPSLAQPEHASLVSQPGASAIYSTLAIILAAVFNLVLLGARP
jgi:hypothetical protein